MKSCIYQILNIINGKFYIGHSQNYDIRWWEHERRLRKNRHENSHLQAAWNKYGSSNFEFILIELVEFEFLLAREQFWIDLLGACDNELGYNINPDALRPPSPIGRKHSPETRLKISKATTGVPKSSYLRQPFTEEHKENIRQGSIGKVLSEEHKRKIREAGREASTWPHEMGNKCKCNECKTRRNKYYRDKYIYRDRRISIRII
jgi:group I intron endonuclease